MSDAPLGFLLGILVTIVMMLVISVAGSKACVEATGAESCVKEWRAVTDGLYRDK